MLGTQLNKLNPENSIIPTLPPRVINVLAHLDGLGVGSLAVALEQLDVALVERLEVLLGLLVVGTGATLVLAQVVLAAHLEGLKVKVSLEGFRKDIS